jgi:hypothetical protein
MHFIDNTQGLIQFAEVHAAASAKTVCIDHFVSDFVLINISRHWMDNSSTQTVANLELYIPK